MFCNSRAPAAQPCAPNGHGRGGGGNLRGTRREKGEKRGRKGGEGGRAPHRSPLTCSAVPRALPAAQPARTPGMQPGSAGAAPLPPAAEGSGSSRGPGEAAEEAGRRGGTGSHPRPPDSPARSARGCSVTGGGEGREPSGPGALREPSSAGPGRTRARLPRGQHGERRVSRACSRRSPPEPGQRASARCGGAAVLTEAQPGRELAAPLQCIFFKLPGPLPGSV